MPEFLSAEWFALVDGTDLGCDPSISCTVEQLVTGGPAGDVRYRVSIADGRLRLEPGPGPADVSLRLGWSCAVALATGRNTAHDAFQQGEVRCAGDLRALQAFGNAIAAAGQALGRLQDQTTYPADGDPRPLDIAPTRDSAGR